MDDEKFKMDLIKRLNVLIALILDQNNPQFKTSMSDKINTLKDYGLSSTDVANIVNKRLNYVTSISSMKKKRKDKNG